MITSENVFCKAQFKNFLISWKKLRYQIFVISRYSINFEKCDVMMSNHLFCFQHQLVIYATCKQFATFFVISAEFFCALSKRLCFNVHKQPLWKHIARRNCIQVIRYNLKQQQIIKNEMNEYTLMSNIFYELRVSWSFKRLLKV